MTEPTVVGRHPHLRNRRVETWWVRGCHSVAAPLVRLETVIYCAAMRTDKLRRSIGGAAVLVLLASGAACSHSKPKPAAPPATSASAATAAATPTTPAPSA